MFESLSNNRNEFPLTFEKLTSMFGIEVKSSCVMVANMASDAKLIGRYESKIKEMREFAANQGLKITEFETQDEDHLILEDRYQLQLS